jgi:hypothetical protein
MTSSSQSAFAALSDSTEVCGARWGSVGRETSQRGNQTVATDRLLNGQIDQLTAATAIPIYSARMPAD